jgi:hypothetical protein
LQCAHAGPQGQTDTGMLPSSCIPDRASAQVDQWLAAGGGQAPSTLSLMELPQSSERLQGRNGTRTTRKWRADPAAIKQSFQSTEKVTSLFMPEAHHSALEPDDDIAAGPVHKRMRSATNSSPSAIVHKNNQSKVSGRENAEPNTFNEWINIPTQMVHLRLLVLRAPFPFSCPVCSFPLPPFPLTLLCVMFFRNMCKTLQGVVDAQRVMTEFMDGFASFFKAPDLATMRRSVLRQPVHTPSIMTSTGQSLRSFLFHPCRVLLLSATCSIARCLLCC